MLQATLTKNDSKAKWLIGIVSVIVFCTVTVLGKYNLAGKVTLPFDVHIFALINACLNGCVAFLLVLGLVTVKQKKYQLHKSIMLLALLLSVLFLVSYICHHLFAGETAFGEIDGIKGLSESEMAAVGSTRSIYLLILLTHIPLAGLVLPFILLAAYRALTGEFAQHKKLVRYVWPIWFYVAVTGVIVYLMICPYYK
jgi:putative membrane protein